MVLLQQRLASIEEQSLVSFLLDWLNGRQCLLSLVHNLLGESLL